MTQTLGLGLTEEQEDTIRCFRQTLDMLERGLAMDGPLKRQLLELEMREQEAMADVEELEARNQRLTMSLEGVRSKREILEEVMHSAGTLQGALGQGKAGKLNCSPYEKKKQKTKKNTDFFFISL